MWILDVSFVFFFFAITKLILKIWGELHRNKKDWERITPSPSGSGWKGERLPEGKEAQKGPAADSGQREHHRSWGPGALRQETPAWGHWLQAHSPRARGLHRKPQSYLASPFPFAFLASAAWSACPSAWGTIAPAAQYIPLTELLCLFLFFWRESSCWLPRVTLTAATLPFCTWSRFSFLSLIHAHHPDFPLSLPLHIWPQLLSCLLPWSFLLQFSSVAQSCMTLCDPMHCSTAGFPVHHQLRELTQTHVHWVGDAIQPFHPLSSPSPPDFNLPQHQSLFKGVTSLYQVAKGLEFHFQHQSFQWTPRTDLL